MIKVYESFDFLDFKQALEYLQCLGFNQVTEAMLMQLIREQKIPFYMDLDGHEGNLEADDLADGSEKVFGIGLSRFHEGSIKSNDRGSLNISGVFEGLVRLQEVEFKPEVRRWIPKLKELVPAGMLARFQSLNVLQNEVVSDIDTSFSYEKDLYFSANYFRVKPEDVNSFFSTLSSAAPQKEAQNKQPTQSELLMIAFLRDMLCNPSDGSKQHNQTTLAYGLEERFGVSISTSEKIFAAATRAKQDR